MKTTGFVKTSMPEEFRVALLPKDIKDNISHPDLLFFEKGYAKELGVSDGEYLAVGVNIVSRNEAYSKDILCIPKTWVDDIDSFKPDQILMGWLYLSEKKKIAQAVLDNKMTAISWENMYDSDKNYVFEKNRWYAGYISTVQALPFASASPKNLKIAVLGNGRVAKGVFSRLDEEGASYEIFGTNLLSNPNVWDSKSANLILTKLKSEIHKFDVVINCWYYDPSKGNYLSLDDLQEMKAGALFIDVASEGVEGSIPHPSISPFYKLGRFNPILVYNNNHSPGYWPLDVSQSISESFAPILNAIVKDEPNPFLEKATVVKEGVIIDTRIKSLLNL